MKLKNLFILLGLLTALVVVSAVAIRNFHRPNESKSDRVSRPADREFSVQGVVRGVEPESATVHIAHENIPGFMPAMTMPFTVKDPGLLNGLARGQTVRFRLHVDRDSAWIDEIETVAKPAAETSRDNVPEPDASRVEVGRLVPDFVLRDQEGKDFRLSDWRGKAVLVTFIYTRCPIPNFCPLMSKNFAALQERLNRECPGRFHLLSVSFDPEYDRPEVLKDYASRFSTDPKTWTFACGSKEQVGRVTGLFGLVHEPENGTILHDLRTALISPEGRLVHVWRSNAWTPYEVDRMLRETLVRPGDLATR